MNITIVNTHTRGGAAKAALRLHEGLRQRGISSKFLSRNNSNPNREISAATARSRAIAERISDKIKRLFRIIHTSLDETPGIEKISSCELFTDCRSNSGRHLLPNDFDGDVINLHWIAHFVDLPTIINQFAGRIPFVWTLHDMQPLTGGCHYDKGCARFARQCGNCPQLVNSGANDASRQIFRSRELALSCLEDKDLHIVCPSRWLADEVTKSSLLRRFDCHVIPNGLDTTQFAPVDRHCARTALGIRADTKVVLFVADSVENHRKGLDLLLAAARHLADKVERLCLVSVGGGAVAAKQISSVPLVEMGHVNDRLLPAIYSAADLLVIPSRQDNLPNAMLESMACGTPVVGFNIGGIPDVVRPDSTGWLAAVSNADCLAATLWDAFKELELPSIAARYRSTCRNVVVQEYNFELQAQRYTELFSKLIAYRCKGKGGQVSLMQKGPSI